MTDALPAWATAPPFDPTRDWIPIICTGTAAKSHAYELVGIYFDEAALGWAYRGRPAFNAAGALAGSHLTPTRTGTTSSYYLPDSDEVVTVRWSNENGRRVDTRRPAAPEDRAGLPLPDGTWYLGTRNSGQGSIIVGCPSCPSEHRVGRVEWGRWLAACVSLRRADVTTLR